MDRVDHRMLLNKNAKAQHSIDSIDGLREEISNSGNIRSIKVNGAELAINNKAVDITVPTAPEDISAAAEDHTHTAEDVGAVPAAETIQRGADGFCKLLEGDIHDSTIPTGLYMGSGLTNAPGSAWYYYIVMRHTRCFAKS